MTLELESRLKVACKLLAFYQVQADDFTNFPANEALDRLRELTRQTRHNTQNLVQDTHSTSQALVDATRNRVMHPEPPAVINTPTIHPPSTFTPQPTAEIHHALPPTEHHQNIMHHLGEMTRQARHSIEQHGHHAGQAARGLSHHLHDVAHHLSHHLGTAFGHLRHHI